MEIKDDDQWCYRHLKFDTATRNSLSQKFIAALLVADPDFIDIGGYAELEGDHFVRCLEGIAEYAEMNIRRESQKRRRERLEAMANALEDLIGYMRAVDDAALGYALWNGLNEASKHDAVFSDNDRTEVQMNEGMPTVFLALRLQKGHEAEALKSFAEGVRKSIKTLPQLDKRQHDFIDLTAKFIEDYLARRNIEVSTSDTGLAGSALIATIELAGNPAPRAGYRMKLAKESHDSWQNFVARMKDRNAGEAAE